MADKLSVYNEALRYMSQRSLASLTEEGKARRALDREYNNAIDDVLADSLWNFAMKTVEISADTDLDPVFGFQNAFTRPDDFVRLVNISDNEAADTDLPRFDVDKDNWYADVEKIYVKYISNDSAYGYSINDWPRPFASAVAATLAAHTCYEITGDKSIRNDCIVIARDKLSAASRLDAMEERVKFSPMGSWAQSRLSGRRSASTRRGVRD
jgi:hypothetical protein